MARGHYKFSISRNASHTIQVLPVAILVDGSEVQFCDSLCYAIAIGRCGLRQTVAANIYLDKNTCTYKSCGDMIPSQWGLRSCRSSYTSCLYMYQVRKRLSSLRPVDKTLNSLTVMWRVGESWLAFKWMPLTYTPGRKAIWFGKKAECPMRAI